MKPIQKFCGDPNEYPAPNPFPWKVKNGKIFDVNGDEVSFDGLKGHSNAVALNDGTCCCQCFELVGGAWDGVWQVANIATNPVEVRVMDVDPTTRKRAGFHLWEQTEETDFGDEIPKLYYSGFFPIGQTKTV